MTRPSRASPSVRLRENEPTPAIAITPSAMQATKMRKPCKPAAQFAKRKAQRAKFGGERGRGQRHAGFGAYRLRRMWTGQNSSSGIPIIMPASQT